MSYGSCTGFTGFIAKKQITEKDHSQPVPKKWRGDLLGRGKALWNAQERQPWPLTETTCSVAKRILNCKALPVFILLPGLQLVVRDRDSPFEQLRRAGCLIQTGVWLQWPVQLPWCMLRCWDKFISTWKQVTNDTTKMVFFFFTNTLQIIFFPVDTRKRECLDNLLSLKNPDVAESWILAYTMYHYLQIPLLATPHYQSINPEYTPPYLPSRF